MVGGGGGMQGQERLGSALQAAGPGVAGVHTCWFLALLLNHCFQDNV